MGTAIYDNISVRAFLKVSTVIIPLPNGILPHQGGKDYSSICAYYMYIHKMHSWFEKWCASEVSPSSNSDITGLYSWSTMINIRQRLAGMLWLSIYIIDDAAVRRKLNICLGCKHEAN